MRSLIRTALVAATIVPVILAVVTAPAAAVELGKTCTNSDDGYTVGVPDGWYHNERVEGDGLDDIAACRFFSPSDFEVRPASEASGIAISITREETPPRAEGTETTVGGKRATIIETQVGEDGYEPAGTRHYQYWIDMSADWLVVGTSDGPNYVGGYDDNKAILDAMMESFTFNAASLPDTAMPLPPIGDDAS